MLADTDKKFANLYGIPGVGAPVFVAFREARHRGYDGRAGFAALFEGKLFLRAVGVEEAIGPADLPVSFSLGRIAERAAALGGTVECVDPV